VSESTQPRRPGRFARHPVVTGPGITRGAAYATVYLFALTLLLGVGNLLFTAHEVAASQAAQQRAGQVVERKLCASFGRLARLQPPAGDPQANPSRAYLQQEHEALQELGADIGCRR
jgi:hypothetical protein